MASTAGEPSQVQSVEGEASASTDATAVAAPSWSFHQSDSDEIQHVYFDLTRDEPTADERAAFRILVAHMARRGISAVPRPRDDERAVPARMLTAGDAETTDVTLSFPSGLAPSSETVTVIGSELLADAPAPTVGDNAFSRLYPMIAAAWAAHGREPNGFRIKAKTEGFRRCGIAHSKEWRTFSREDIHAHRLSVDAIESFFADPNLTIELV